MNREFSNTHVRRCGCAAGACAQDVRVESGEGKGRRGAGPEKLEGMCAWVLVCWWGRGRQGAKRGKALKGLRGWRGLYMVVSWTGVVRGKCAWCAWE